MAYSIISNKKNTSFVLHVAAANINIIVAGNNSVSNVATSDEVLSGAYLTQAAWGCDPAGYIVLKRGANVAAVFDSSAYIDYAGNGLGVNLYNGANIAVDFVGTANGYVILEFQKIGTFTTEYNLA